MTEINQPEPISEFDRRIARGERGLLADFNRAGALEAADVHVATRLGVLGEETDPRVLLAVALTVRAARRGATCLNLLTIAEKQFDVSAPLDWPAPTEWLAAVAASPLTGLGVLRVEEPLLYLDRHWREEEQICDDLRTRLARPEPEVAEEVLTAALDRLFPAGWAEQRAAAEAAARSWTTVLTGGPGTGKTASVARLLALIAEQYESHGRTARIALAAPTGKAATRLHESVLREAGRLTESDRARVAGLTASTVHRLLGWRPDSRTRFRHRRDNPLPYDVVVVDEVSMVSLSQMARLLEALRPETRLVLVGDPDQLASVEAGAVLADLVEGLSDRADSPVVRLRTTHRTKTQAGSGAALDDLAGALRAGDADQVLQILTADSTALRLVDPADDAGLARVRAEIADGAERLARLAAQFQDPEDRVAVTDLVEDHRLLCAHREGRFGVAGWNRQVEYLLTERTGISTYAEWYPGRPVLITANDRGLGLSNGDIGVVVRQPDGRVRVAVRTGAEVHLFAPTRLTGVETAHAMTVHKSQGSEARAVTVVLPPADSPLATKELFYTAVTRARERLTVVGSEEAIRAAVGRTVDRASGLRDRLRR